MMAQPSVRHANETAQTSLGQVGSWLTPERDGSRAAPIRGLPSTAAVAGHPIHPMMIPYPIAFLTAVVATDVAARVTRDPFWSRASRLLLGVGIASGAAAGAVGVIDYATIRRAREKPVGKVHAYGNPIALALAGLNLAMRRNRDARGGVVPTGGEIALSAATAVLLGVTGWAGAELSYRHMVGVDGHGDQHTEEEKRVVP